MVKQDQPFDKPILAGPDPLVLLHVPHDGTQDHLLHDFATEVSLKGLYFPESSFQPLLWMGVSSSQTAPLQLARTAGQ